MDDVKSILELAEEKGAIEREALITDSVKEY